MTSTKSRLAFSQVGLLAVIGLIGSLCAFYQTLYNSLHLVALLPKATANAMALGITIITPAAVVMAVHLTVLAASAVATVLRPYWLSLCGAVARAVADIRARVGFWFAGPRGGRSARARARTDRLFASLRFCIRKRRREGFVRDMLEDIDEMRAKGLPEYTVRRAVLAQVATELWQNNRVRAALVLVAIAIWRWLRW